MIYKYQTKILGEQVNIVRESHEGSIYWYIDFYHEHIGDVVLNQMTSDDELAPYRVDSNFGYCELDGEFFETWHDAAETLLKAYKEFKNVSC